MEPQSRTDAITRPRKDNEGEPVPGSGRDDAWPPLASHRRWLKSAAAPALAALLIGLAPYPVAHTQTTGSNAQVIPFRIAAPGTIAAAGGGAPTGVAIEVSPIDKLPSNAFVRIKGLPEGAALTDGYAVGPGSWAVALKSLEGLKAYFPPMPAGRKEVGLQLLSVDGAVLAETQTVLVFAAPAPAPSPPAAAAPAPPRQAPAARAPDPVPKPPEMAAEDRQKAEKMVSQGDRFLDSGNVAVARQFFQRAADAGLAAGAMKLAATFDPAELDRLAVQGVVAQPAEAKRWYERAWALGAREAKERLARLANTN